MQKRFPDKKTKLLLACSNGTAYSYDALEALEEAGYENLSFVKGGFNHWFRIFDAKFTRRCVQP
jgi:rhodanese-related sulfurtransferase